MLRPHSLPLVASFTVVLLLAAYRGSSDESADTTLAPSTTEQVTTTTAASTTNAAITTTVAAVTTTTEALPDVEDPGSGEQWDLVWISDSMGAGVALPWAERIEESEGVEVRVHDHWTPGLSLVEVREWLSEDAELRDEVADAEIIVVGGAAEYASPEDTGMCHLLPPTPSDPPNVYTSADFAPYGDALRDIFDIVFELRAGQPTVIRAFDQFNGMIADLRAYGIEAECKATWDSESEVLHEAADDYGVAMASFYDEFNGPDHDEDPERRATSVPTGGTPCWKECWPRSRYCTRSDTSQSSREPDPIRILDLWSTVDDTVAAYRATAALT